MLRLPEIHSFEAWVVYLDVFGFSAYLNDSDLEEASERLRKAHEGLYDLLSDSEPGIHVRLISDSIFLIFPISEDQSAGERLQACIERVQRILGDFVSLELPLRGGMAFGEIILSGDLLLGSAVVRAVRYERLIASPLVVLPLKEIDKLSDALRPSGITNFDVTGNGLMAGILVQPRPIDGLRELAQAMMQRCARNGPFTVARQWESACQHIETYIEGRQLESQ